MSHPYSTLDLTVHSLSKTVRRPRHPTGGKGVGVDVFEPLYPTGPRYESLTSETGPFSLFLLVPLTVHSDPDRGLRPKKAETKVQ